MHLSEDIQYRIFFTVGALVIILIFREVSRIIIRNHTQKYQLDSSRRVYINKFFNFTFSVILLIVLGVIWDISMKGLSVYFASFFAIVGVALFAQWSIISSVTASVILFFTSPFKIGTKIKIMDGADSVEGIVKDITFFNIHIETDEKLLITYPNNLALLKPIVLISNP